MKRKTEFIILPIFFLLGSIIIFPFKTSFCQSNWFPQNSGVSQNLNSISFYSNGLTGWAAGNSGVILMTTNGGNTWIQRTSNTVNNLRCIVPAVSNQISNVYAVGDNGTLLRSTNSGNNWTVISSSTFNNLNSISFNGLLNGGFAVGNSGTIIKTTDGGLTWSQRISGTSEKLNSVFSWYTSAFIVGNNGIFLRSFNSGETWSPQSTGTGFNLNCILGELWAVGDNGIIIRSSNDGDNWIHVNSGTTNRLNSGTFSIPYIFISGNNGTIIKVVTTGNLISISTESSGTSQNLNSIYFQGPFVGYGWTTGNNGVILKDTSEGWRISSKLLDANTISTWFRNNGSFNNDPVTHNSGFEWPKSSQKHARYASSLWIGAKVGIDTLVTGMDYEYEYLPGFTSNNGVPTGKNDTSYRVYKLYHGIKDNDRARWPNALLGNSDQGAPVYFDTLSNSWKPLDFADQTMFYRYTDSYPESHGSYHGNTLPLKADVKQINWSYDEPGPIGNMTFTEFQVINRSSAVWNDCYIAFWTDDDIGFALDDNIGCDTNFQLGYAYNDDDYDDEYGVAPPAVGTVLLYGGDIYTGNPNDTAIFCDKLRRINKVGYKFKKMYALNFYSDPPYNPRNYRESYWFMSGLMAQSGQPIINPVTQQPTRYFYNGDPVTNQGWVQNWGYAGEDGFLLSTGPFNISPGDTQRFVIAQVIARGTSNLNSITLLRQYAQIAIDNYRNCFANVPIGINSNSEINYQFRLFQNYPNPFNAGTKFIFETAGFGKVTLRIYNLLGQEVALLVDRELMPGRHEAEWDGTNFASGVYFYELKAGDFTDTKKMVLMK